MNSPPQSSQPIRPLLQKAVALHQAGRLAEARDLYTHILTLQPRQFDALHLLGVLALQSGNAAQGLALIDDAIAVNPGSAPAHFNRGNALQSLERLDEAVSSYDTALGLNPGFADVYKNRGRVQTMMKRPEDALASYDHALSLRPDDVEVWNSRGILLRTLGRLEEALSSYDRVLALRPDAAAAWYNRANTLQELQRLEEALASYDKALSVEPGYVEACNNRGNALRRLKRLDEALASFDRALALKPDEADTHTNRGNTLKELRRLDEAIASYDRAIALRPDHADAHWNKSLALLLQGDFERGLPLHEWRWESGDTRRFKRSFIQPLWLGTEPLAGKTILLQAEQGLGDTIQLCRYAPMVRERGARVLLAVPGPLLGLLQGLAGVDELIEKKEPWPAFDFYCPLFSLPLAFRTRLETIPTPGPYLKPRPDRVAAWRERLGPRPRPRIGLVWSSTSKFENDADRSMEFARFIQAIPPQTFDVICLQKEIKEQDRGDFERHGEVRFFGDLLTDFSETAALASCMDIVVSTCTSVPHLTGALGIPTWLVLGHVPDWRWLLDREDSPWYRSMKLYRQDADWRWEPVLQRVAADLKQTKFAPRAGS